MTRTRLRADEARRRILEAAEKRLIEGGPEAVRVQLVARDLGLTDAAVHHHFGSREGLLDALIRFGARRLRDACEEAVRAWDPDSPDVADFIALALDSFESRGYSRLALWLALAGMGDEQSGGMFSDLAAALHRARVLKARRSGAEEPSEDDTHFLAALLVMALIAEPVLGGAARRLVGLPGDEPTTRRFRGWLADSFRLSVLRSNET